MAKYRIVKVDDGVDAIWRVEKKSLFWWSDLFGDLYERSIFFSREDAYRAMMLKIKGPKVTVENEFEV